MFNRHKSDKPEITLILDRPDGVYFPGDTVVVNIEITPHQALKVRSGSVRLRCIEWFQYRQMDPENTGTGQFGTAFGNNEIFSLEQIFLDATTLLADTPQHFSLHLGVPEDATPGFTGDSLRVTWQLDVKIDRHLAKDFHAETFLEVRMPTAEIKAAPGEYGQSDEPEEAGLSFTLPGLEACTGDTLTGELCVQPHKDFEAKVRLVLTCGENVFRDEGDQHRRNIELILAEGTRFTAGQPMRFPFQLTIPAEAPPTVHTPNGSIDWYLRGILDRPAHKDTAVRQSLVIHPAG